MVLLSSFIVRRPLYLELGSSRCFGPRISYRGPYIECQNSPVGYNNILPSAWGLTHGMQALLFGSRTPSLSYLKLCLCCLMLDFPLLCPVLNPPMQVLGTYVWFRVPLGDSSALFQGPSIPRRALYPEPRLIPYLYTYVLLPELRTHSHCTTTIRLTLECFCLASDLSSDLPLKIVT